MRRRTDPDRCSRGRSARRLWSSVVLAALIPTLLPSPARPQERAEGSDFIRVTEEPWKVGEVRSYTLLFDRAPFGRERIRLEEVQGAREDRRLWFTQTLVLDLRALGQEGSVLSYSSVRYEQGRHARAYSAEILVRERTGYSTYQAAGGRDPSHLLQIDLAASPPRMTWSGKGQSRDITLPPTEGTMLVDPLSMGHWERLFLGDIWRLGDVRTRDLLLPLGAFRFDYHRDARWRELPDPRRMRVTVKVEARETVEVFSVPIPAFRCRIPELGYTLFVSSSGGILRFEDGRGLVVSLER